MEHRRRRLKLWSILSAIAIFSAGALTGLLTPATSQVSVVPQNWVWAGPGSGGPGLPAWRLLVGADLPAPTVSTLGGIEAINAVAHEYLTSIDSSGVPHLGTVSFADIVGVTGNPTAIGQVFNSTGSNAGAFTATPQLGQVSTTTGSLAFANSGSANLLTVQSASIATSARTVTFPDPGANDSIAYLAATQTFTNKTLSGTTTLSGLSSGTCVFGIAIDSSNHIITGSCPGTATNITVGTTTVTSGTSPFCLNDNSGTLGNVSCALLTAQDQALTGGANVTPNSIGSVSSGTTTIDCGKSPLQWMVNTGASTIAAPTNDGSCVIEVINGNGAGAITLSNFSNKSPAGVTFAQAATGSATVTFTNSSAVINWTANGLNLNSAVFFTTTGSLPTNFTAGTIYYVQTTGTNSIQVSATPGGSAITAGSAGSGTQTGTDPSVYDFSINRVNGIALSSWTQVQ